jgi:hypothetical protein
MNPEDLILDLFAYFSKFVPKDTLRGVFIQPVASRIPGYDDVQGEVMPPVEDCIIPEIGTFVVSLNEKFVSERIKNSKSFILFVEYGKISLDFKVGKGVKQSMAVTVAHPFTDSNSDNVNELLRMNRCLVLLQKIIQQMDEDQGDLDFCTYNELVDYPVDIQPVDPANFYGCGGWCAMFQRVSTMLV